MLFDLEPDRSVTGGAFYEGDKFDKELVEVCYHLQYLTKTNRDIQPQSFSHFYSELV